MGEDHSSISPSQAERFFNCPASVSAQAKIDIIEPSNEAALEGSAIHELAARCLKEDIDPYTLIGETVEVKDNYGDIREYIVNDDFAFTVRMYRNKILSLLDQHGLTQKALQVETHFRIPEIDPKARGTTDCSFIGGGTLYVIDLKGGRGIIVDPEENKQCMYYALRPFIDARMFVKKVVLIIIQPRAKEGDYIKEWETTPARLKQFADELINAIARTRVEKPEFKSGEHCRFCKAQGNCPALQKNLMQTVQNAFPQVDRMFPAVSELTPEQIGNALPALEVLKGFIENLEGYAFSLAKKGVEIPNHTLVRSRKQRRYIDENAVVDAFLEEFGNDVYAERKLRSPAQLEKIVGKDALSKFVETPEGDLKLMPTKEATEYIQTTVEKAFKDVKFD